LSGQAGRAPELPQLEVAALQGLAVLVRTGLVIAGFRKTIDVGNPSLPVDHVLDTEFEHAAVVDFSAQHVTVVTLQAILV
jgi:hypothetical protein